MTTRDRIGVILYSTAYFFAWTYGYFIIRSFIDTHFFGSENLAKPFLLQPKQLEFYGKIFITLGGVVVPTAIFYRVAFEPRLNINYKIPLLLFFVAAIVLELCLFRRW